MFSCYQLGFSAWQHGPGNCNIANAALNRIQTKPEGLCRFLVKNKFLSIALHLKLVHRSLGSCWDLNCYTWKCCCCCRHFGMMAFGWAALAPGQNIFTLSNDAMGRFHWGRGRSLPAEIWWWYNITATGRWWNYWPSSRRKNVSDNWIVPNLRHSLTGPWWFSCQVRTHDFEWSGSQAFWIVSVSRLWIPSFKNTWGMLSSCDCSNWFFPPPSSNDVSWYLFCCRPGLIFFLTCIWLLVEDGSGQALRLHATFLKVCCLLVLTQVAFITAESCSPDFINGIELDLCTAQSFEAFVHLLHSFEDCLMATDVFSLTWPPGVWYLLETWFGLNAWSSVLFGLNWLAVTVALNL